MYNALTLIHLLNDIKTILLHGKQVYCLFSIRKFVFYSLFAEVKIMLRLAPSISATNTDVIQANTAFSFHHL